MKKIIAIILVVSGAIFYFFSPYYVLAKEDEDSEAQKILDEQKEKLEDFYKYINDKKTDVELLNNLDAKEYVYNYIKSGEGNLSLKTVLDAVISLLFKEVKSVLTLTFSILAIAIFSDLISNLQESFTSKGVSKVAFYACYITLIMLLSKSFFISIEVAKDVIYGVSDFMNSLLPFLLSMTSLSGGIVQAATLDPIIMMLVIIIPKIYVNFIIPFILISFALEFANNLSSGNKINNLCKIIKQIIVWVQGIIMTGFVAVLTVKGITGKTIDAVTLKTTKFAVDNFIPVVGKSFSDAITSVASYALIIKNALTTLGLVVVILMIAYPIIKITLMTFIYKLTAALVEPISDKRIVSTIESVAKSMVLILSCVFCISLLFFILMGMMALAGKQV